jgi:hypothetical protein
LLTAPQASPGLGSVFVPLSPLAKLPSKGLEARAVAVPPWKTARQAMIGSRGCRTGDNAAEALAQKEYRVFSAFSKTPLAEF